MSNPQKLSEADKAVLVAYVLGKCMLMNTGILVHEAKVSNQKELKALYKIASVNNVKLAHAFHTMFKGATSHLNPKQIEFLMEAISGLIDNLWSKAGEANETSAEKESTSQEKT